MANRYRCSFNRLLYQCEATTPSEARSKAQTRWGLSDQNAARINVIDEGAVEVSHRDDPLISNN